MSIKDGIQFIGEVKKEAQKVSWPSRKETVTTSIMVFVMVLIMALFFLGVDQFFSVIVRYIFGISG